jgi:hypothetical protein
MNVPNGPETFVGRFVVVRAGGDHLLGFLRRVGGLDDFWMLESEDGAPIAIRGRVIDSIRVGRPAAEARRELEMMGVFTPPLPDKRREP